jgi:hypothetical protein
MRNLLILTMVAVSLWANPAAAADDAKEAFAAASKLYEEGDIDGAIEEAEWGLELLRQLKRNSISAHFLDEVAGFRGEQIETNSAMGMTIIERAYVKDGDVIQVTLTGGSSSSMGGLGAIASMGMMGGGERVRIQRQTGNAISEGGNHQIFFGLKNAGMLNLESSDVSMDALKAFAEAFPIADLDAAAAGN